MDKAAEASRLERQAPPKSLFSQLLEHSEIILNNINHGLIALTTFYATWYCIITGWSGHLSQHTFISTIGYQLLMAEGIMVMYKRNTYTAHIKTRETKATIHWVLLAVGSILAIWGTMVEWLWRQERHHHSFKQHRHARWGLVSLIFLLPTMLSGVLALFPMKIQRFLKPLFSKFSHNFFATVAFVTGMVSTIQGYTDLRWTKNNAPVYMTTTMAWSLAIVTAITMIGPIRTFYQQGRSFLGR